METKTKQDLENKIKFDSTHVGDSNYMHVIVVKSIVETVVETVNEGEVKKPQGSYTVELESLDDLNLTIRQALKKYIIDVDHNMLDKENASKVASFRGILGQREIKYTLPGNRPVNDRDLDNYKIRDYMITSNDPTNKWNAFQLLIKNDQGGGIEFMLDYKPKH